MKHGSTILTRLYRLKLLALATILVLAGVLASIFGSWLEAQSVGHLFVALTNGIADVLVVTGGFGIAIDFFTGREKEEAEAERTRSVLKELTPDFTDAVLKGLEVRPDDLKRVATPELLDTIATNALGLRLGDAQFAREVYEDVRAQAIRSPERWHDLDVTVRLSEAKGSTGEPRAPLRPRLFDVTITWDYSLVPSSAVQRFACVSDRDEFRELLGDVPSTSTWYLSPQTGHLPTDRSAYELLSYSIDGEERPIRRSATKTRQTYSVEVGEQAVRAGKPVRVRHSLRAVVTRKGHWLQIALTQPTKGLSLSLDYTDTDIAVLQVTDLVSSAKQPWVTYLPKEQPTRMASLEVPGWLLPQAQITFIWTLDDEATSPGSSSAPRRSPSPPAA